MLKGTIITINAEMRDLEMSHAISDGWGLHLWEFNLIFSKIMKYAEKSINSKNFTLDVLGINLYASLL